MNAFYSAFYYYYQLTNMVSSSRFHTATWPAFGSAAAGAGDGDGGGGGELGSAAPVVPAPSCCMLPLSIA